MARLDLAARAATLAAAGTPFVWATVVRAERPTSAKPGDSALVLADGQIDGFVGGDCAESTVRAQALEVLATAEPRLLRITPLPEDVSVADDGAVTVYNPCLSGGTLDIFLEPAVPLPRRRSSGLTNKMARSPGDSALTLRPRRGPKLVSRTTSLLLARATLPWKGLFSPTKLATKAVSGRS